MSDGHDSKRSKATLRAFVDEAIELRREQEPHVFSPLGAQIPYAWAHLQRWYRGRYTRFEDAQTAALSLTGNDWLRSLYTESSDGRMWLEEQIENLARRSMMLATSANQVGDLFERLYPRFVRELNRDRYQALAIHEIWGLTVPGKARYRPKRGPGIDPVTTWIEQGDIANIADRMGAYLPPALLGATRLDQPDAIFVSLRSTKKSQRTLTPSLGLHGEEMFDYTRAAQLATGQRVELGTSLSAELSPFPRDDSHLYEREKPRTPWGTRKVLTLTPTLHRRIRSFQVDLKRVPRGVRERNTSLSYALNKFERIARLDGYWSDAVVDSVSIFESLFSTDDERNARIADRMTWLSGLSGVTAEQFLTRVRALFGVRNDIIHAGKVGDDTLAKALRALGGDVPKPTTIDPYPEWRFYEIWYVECHPRLLRMLRWAIEFALKADGKLTKPALRAIDDSIVLGRAGKEWKMMARGVPPPIDE